MNRPHLRLDAHTRRSTGPVNVRFEGLVEDLEEKYKELLCFHDDSMTVESKNEHLLDMCRLIRFAKLRYYKVLEMYGPAYRNEAQRFVELAHDISELAEVVHAPLRLRHSFRRHAREIEEARMAARDQQ